MQETTKREQLAPELIAHIFDLASRAARSDPTDGPQDRIGLRSHPVDPTSPTTLSHICKGWRHIALSTPSLWSTIYITNGSPGQLSLLQLWLERSKPHPLRLVIQDGIGFTTRHAQTVAQILKDLCEHSERWEWFKVKVAHLTPPIPLKGVANALLRVETPQLRALAFTFATEPAYAGAFLDISKRLLTNSPQLSEVHFWNDIDYKPELLSLLPFDRLAILNLILVTLNVNCRIVEALSKCKCLDVLSVSLDQFNFQFQPRSITSIPSLRFLNIIDHEHSYKLINALHLPGLKKFSLHIVTENPNAPDMYAAPENLWERSGCRLLDFALRDVRPEHTGRLLMMLRKPALHSLKELRLGSDVGVDIFQLLTIENAKGDSASDEFVLPSLEFLHFEAVMDDEEATLGKMVLSRMAAASKTGVVSRVIMVRAKFSSKRKLEAEVQFWDEHEKDLAKVDRRFAQLEDDFSTYAGELVFQDISMVQGFHP